VSTAWMKDLEVVSSARMSPEKTGLVRSVFLPLKELLKAATSLYEQGYFIEDVSVLDTSDGFMVVYHFDHFTTPGRVALRVLVPHENPEVPSISGIFSGADWHERECHDFFGVTFTGHPNLVPLLLPDDADFHPLVKEGSARKRIAELMSPGEVEQSAPAFKALFTPTEPEGGGESGAEKAEIQTESGPSSSKGD
jgi:NADH-quinone oxidoreductase subunit C